MRPKIEFLGFEASDYQFLANLLAEIHAPRVTKSREEDMIGILIEEPVEPIPIELLLDKIATKGPHESSTRQEELKERNHLILATALIVLDAIGAANVTDNRTVAATTESAGHLLHSLSCYLRIHADEPTHYRPIEREDLHATKIDPCVNPFLQLVRIAERHRKEWAERQKKLDQLEPINEKTYVSVLIKGERKRSEKGPSSKGATDKEMVFLHFWKEDRQGYALPGSERLSDETYEQTATRALHEDFPSQTGHIIPEGSTDSHDDQENLPRFVLKESRVSDVLKYELSKRGAFTKYTANLCWVESIEGRLAPRRELKPIWCTYEEVENRETREGKHIATDPNLLRAVKDQIDKIPVVVVDAHPFDRPLVEYVKDVVKEARDVRKSIQVLLKKVAQIIWYVRIWLLIALGGLVSIVFVSPLLETQFPGLSTVADLLGIAGFLATAVGFIVKMQQSRK
jgi:hypothetical protein